MQVNLVTWVADGGRRRAQQVSHANVVNAHACVTPCGVNKLQNVAAVLSLNVWRRLFDGMHERAQACISREGESTRHWPGFF